MKKIFHRIYKRFKRDRWMIRAFIPSLIFNLRHLPFYQARKLPIMIYKGRLMNNTGKYEIKGKVHFGMIELGKHRVSLFPSNGILLENRGVIVFHGRAIIGSDSAISLGEYGRLEFGDNFSSPAGLKIACYDSISFGHNVSIGWNSLFVDTDFHSLKKLSGDRCEKTSFAPITVGHDTWFGNGCKIYKGVSVPAFCIVGADTLLHKKVECEEYSLITNRLELNVRYTGLYLDKLDDKVDYSPLREAR